jgi:signal transduction histidine kinase
VPDARFKEASAHVSLLTSRSFITLGIVIIVCGFLRLLATVSSWTPWDDFALIMGHIADVAAVCAVLTLPWLVPSILAAMRGRPVLASRYDELQSLYATLEQEVAERRSAEQVSKVNLGRLEAIVDNLPLGAAMIGVDKRVIRANQRCCDLLGLHCSWKELAGKPRETYAQQVRSNMKNPEAYDASFEEAFSAKEPVTHQLELRDGRIVERVSIPVAADGQPGGHLLLYRDVTRDVRVSASKSEFMSLASHQLRTPLTAIRWSFGRLQKSFMDRASEAECKLLEDGLESSRRMSHTIDTMLAISRIEAGKIRPAPSEIKVGAFLNDVRVAMRGLYEAKHQAFSLDCQSHLLLVTDADILEEIVTNLYSNAIKYTPDGGNIRVRAVKEYDGIRIDISDDGFGIPVHQQERVFTKFFRADNIVSADTSGTGLGLYLVSLLTKILGGTITFKSLEGKGTVFTLYIPGMA